MGLCCSDGIGLDCSREGWHAHLWTKGHESSAVALRRGAFGRGRVAMYTTDLASGDGAGPQRSTWGPAADPTPNFEENASNAANAHHVACFLKHFHQGRVRNNESKRVLAGSADDGDYMRANLSVNGTATKRRVHHLVLQAFGTSDHPSGIQDSP